MVRGDSGDGGVRAGRRLDARRFTDFVREAGIYRVESRAHVNRYQLFVERALQLDTPGRAHRPCAAVRHRDRYRRRAACDGTSSIALRSTR